MTWPNVNDGDDINAVLWNEAVRDQVVLRFDSTTARDLAVAVPAPGMVSAIASNTAAEGLEVRTSAGTWRRPWNMPWGVMGTAQEAGVAATNIGGTVADAGLSVSFTAVANRLYQATGMVRLVGTDGEKFRGTLTNAANVVITAPFEVQIDTVFDTSVVPFVSVPFTRNAGSETVKLRLQRMSGAGTASVDGGTTFVQFLTVVDLGPSGVPA